MLGSAGFESGGVETLETRGRGEERKRRRSRKQVERDRRGCGGCFVAGNRRKEVEGLFYIFLFLRDLFPELAHMQRRRGGSGGDGRAGVGDARGGRRMANGRTGLRGRRAESRSETSCAPTRQIRAEQRDSVHGEEET